MDEQQIIGDILDKIYGYDIVLREEDTEIIKAKKKEKDEKTKEIKTQINNICKDLENELKAVIGPDVSGIKKLIRLQVLTSIKAEIDNGNNVVDSNGKISVGKTFDIIRQSKSEILEKIQNENDTVNYKKEDGDIIPEDSKEDKGLNNFFDKLDEAGIDLSQDEKDLMAEAVARVNEIMNMIREKVDSGMSNVEALKSILSGMSKEEIELLRAQFILAGQCKVLDSLLENEKNSQKDSSESEKKEGKEDSSKRYAKEDTHFDKEFSKTNSSVLPSMEDINNVFIYLDSAYKQLNGENPSEHNNLDVSKSPNILQTMGLATKLNGKLSDLIHDGKSDSIRAEVDAFITWNDLIRGTNSSQLVEESYNKVPINREYRTYDVKKGVYTKAADEGVTTASAETATESDASKTEELSSIARTITEQAKSYTTPLHEMRHATIENKTISEDSIGELVMESKISDKDIGPYFDRHSKLLTFSREDLYADYFMTGEPEGRNELAEMRDDDTEIIEESVSVTPPSAPTSTTTPRSVPTNIVEEMTVDGLGVTPREQSGTSKKVTLSASTMKALVESQAEARKMLEASGIIHGQTPERPTTGKPETQGAPVADNDEKSGEGPEEH